MTELTAQDVLADLFEEFPDQFLDPVGAAKQVLDRLIDAGFEIRDRDRRDETEDLKAEIARLQEAKRRFSDIADERAIEANELRLENERLRAQLAGRTPDA